MKYLNMKTRYGVETVDQINRADFATYEDFENELIRLVNEYHMCGMPVYVSNKCDKTWNKRG